VLERTFKGPRCGERPPKHAAYPAAKRWTPALFRTRSGRWRDETPPWKPSYTFPVWWQARHANYFSFTEARCGIVCRASVLVLVRSRNPLVRQRRATDERVEPARGQARSVRRHLAPNPNAKPAERHTAYNNPYTAGWVSGWVSRGYDDGCAKRRI